MNGELNKPCGACHARIRGWKRPRQGDARLKLTLVTVHLSLFTVACGPINVHVLENVGRQPRADVPHQQQGNDARVQLIAKGEPAAFDGVLITRVAFDALTAQGTGNGAQGASDEGKTK